MRATVICCLTLALGAGPVAHAQDGQVGTDQPPSVSLDAPDSVPLGEAAAVSVTTINALGHVVVRLQRVECTRIAGPVVLSGATAGGALVMGTRIRPRRDIRYRLCARLRLDDGRVLRAARFLAVR